MNKLKYNPPTIRVNNIIMEETMAAGSAKIYIGTNEDPNLFQLEDWTESDLGDIDHSF